jgi:hypothetical protein
VECGEKGKCAQLRAGKQYTPGQTNKQTNSRTYAHSLTHSRPPVLVDSRFSLYSVAVRRSITPRARVTLSLAHHHESLYRNPKPKTLPLRDSLITASDLLSDLQVETYSSTERVEKTKFILEQMRLLLEVARLKDVESSKAGKGKNGTLNS